MKLIIQPQLVGVPHDSDEEHPGQESIDVNGDWHAAALFLTAGAIAGNVTVSGIDLFENAPQKRILEALQDLGAVLSIRANFVRARKGASNAFQFELLEPSIALPTILLAGAAYGQSVIQGLSILKADANWSNRKAILSQLGFTFKEQDDLLVISAGAYELEELTIATADETLVQAVILRLLAGNKSVALNISGEWTQQLDAFLNLLNQLLLREIKCT
jgi:3-phosphoshikimate 1-carboxyvinyltransferase